MSRHGTVASNTTGKLNYCFFNSLLQLTTKKLGVYKSLWAESIGNRWIPLANKAPVKCACNKSLQWGSKYARGLVVLNWINMDRIVHLWWRILQVKGRQNTQDCQKLKLYQIQINSNINQCFPKQFWCWVDEMGWITVISHSLLYMESHLNG